MNRAADSSSFSSSFDNYFELFTISQYTVNYRVRQLTGVHCRSMNQRLRFVSGVLAIAAPAALLLWYALSLLYRLQVETASPANFSPVSVTLQDTVVLVCMFALCLAGIIVGARWIRESREGAELPLSINPH
jgi:hypothetical protein